MTDTPRDNPPPGEPLARKVGNSFMLDARLTIALDLIANVSERSRTKVIQEAVREYLDRRGYRSTWMPQYEKWRIEVKPGNPDDRTHYDWHKPGDPPPTRRGVER
jgi:hypothetical protein